MENVIFNNVNDLIYFADGLFYDEEDFWNESSRYLFIGIGCSILDSMEDNDDVKLTPEIICQCLSADNSISVATILETKNLPEQVRYFLTGFMVNSEKVQASVSAVLFEKLGGRWPQESGCARSFEQVKGKGKGVGIIIPDVVSYPDSMVR